MTMLLLGIFGAGMLLGILAGIRAPKIWLAGVVVGASGALAAAVKVLVMGTVWDWESALILGGEVVHLRLDALSALFLGLLGLIGGAGAVYGREYWTEHAHPRSACAGRVWWSVLVLCLGLVLVTTNGLHFLIGWELFTLAAYFLVTLDRQRREVRAAGWLYLGASHVAALCLFAFFGILAARTGSWELGSMRDRVELAPLFWLALVAFGLKAGMFPLHVWLPSAHANAPSHVSAMLSGMTLKIGIYGIVRFSGWLPVPTEAGWVVASLGVISAVLGVAFALGQHDLKRLLAYHSVENIGIILIGIGFALVATGQGNAAWGRIALAGGLLHVWNHGLFKSLLFFAAGSVLHATGTREMSRLGGLWRMMPWTASLFALGAVAISGSAAAERFRQRMARLSRPVRCHDGARPVGVGSNSGGNSPRHHRRVGARVFCESLRRGVLGCSAFASGGARARKRPGYARRDGLAGRGVCGNRPCPSRVLAGDLAGRGCLESGVGRSGNTRGVGLARQSPRCAGAAGVRRGRLAVADACNAALCRAR